MSEHDITHATNAMKNYSENELRQVRDHVDNRLASMQPDTQGSADASADDEKKKYIAQHGSNPNAQTTAQNVPEPVSDEVKDLQNEKAAEEHRARGQVRKGDEVTERQREKLQQR